MDDTVRYEAEGGVATITLDDGKVNALGPPVWVDLNAALDRAEKDEVAVVVIKGRPGVWSAGFDLGVLRGGDVEAALGMLRGGFATAARLLEFAAPVVAVCTGHAVAMGTFLLLAADARIGVDGPYRLTANEVAIGLTMPEAAIHLLRSRLTPSHFVQAAHLAAPFSPPEAVAAGFLDRVVPEADLAATVASEVARLSQLDRRAHTATKRRARRDLIAAVRSAVDEEYGAAGAA